MRAGGGLGVELQGLEAVARRPSTVPSLSETWLTSAGSPGATAKPWFCAVTSTRFVPVTRTGWFAPRWPNGSLNVSRPSASPTSWWPRQMPKRDAPEEAAHRLDQAVELGGIARAVADEHRGRFELEHRVGVPGAGTTTASTPDSARRRTIELAAEIEHDDARARATANGS